MPIRKKLAFETRHRILVKCQNLSITVILMPTVFPISYTTKQKICMFILVCDGTEIRLVLMHWIAAVAAFFVLCPVEYLRICRKTEVKDRHSAFKLCRQFELNCFDILYFLG